MGFAIRTNKESKLPFSPSRTHFTSLSLVLSSILTDSLGKFGGIEDFSKAIVSIGTLFLKSWD